MRPDIFEVFLSSSIMSLISKVKTHKLNSSYGSPTTTHKNMKHRCTDGKARPGICGKT